MSRSKHGNEILKEVNNRPDVLSVYSNPERKNVKHKLIQKARKTSEIMPRKSLSRWLVKTFMLISTNHACHCKPRENPKVSCCSRKHAKSQFLKSPSLLEMSQVAQMLHNISSLKAWINVYSMSRDISFKWDEIKPQIRQVKGKCDQNETKRMKWMEQMDRWRIEYCAKCQFGIWGQSFSGILETESHVLQGHGKCSPSVEAEHAPIVVASNRDTFLWPLHGPGQVSMRSPD